jgi:hypothetical protein
MDIDSVLNDFLYQPSSRPTSPTSPTSATSQGPSNPSSAQPRQIDWPQIGQLIHRNFQQHSARTNTQLATLTPSASAVVKREVARCNIDRGYLPDLGVHQEVSAKQPKWHAVLSNLYWKVFRQAFVWNIYQHLLRANLLDKECLILPMDLLKSSGQTHIVTTFLHCFSLIDDLCNGSFTGTVPIQSAGWYSDLEW